MVDNIVIEKDGKITLLNNVSEAETDDAIYKLIHAMEKHDIREINQIGQAYMISITRYR